MTLFSFLNRVLLLSASVGLALLVIPSRGPWNKWGGFIAPFMPRKPLERRTSYTLPAVPGDVGRSPLSSPRDCHAASGFFVHHLKGVSMFVLLHDIAEHSVMWRLRYLLLGAGFIAWASWRLAVLFVS